MKKDYQKPEAELISLTAKEQIATSNVDVGIDGEMGNESNNIFQP